MCEIIQKIKLNTFYLYVVLLIDNFKYNWICYYIGYLLDWLKTLLLMKLWNFLYINICLTYLLYITSTRTLFHLFKIYTFNKNTRSERLYIIVRYNIFMHYLNNFLKNVLFWPFEYEFTSPTLIITNLTLINLYI